MPTVTVRNLPDAVHRALRVRAARHGRSTEAEIRVILEESVSERVQLGSALNAISRQAGVTDDDVEALLASRDRRPAEPPVLE